MRACLIRSGIVESDETDLGRIRGPPVFKEEAGEIEVRRGEARETGVLWEDGEEIKVLCEKLGETEALGEEIDAEVLMQEVGETEVL